MSDFKQNNKDAKEYYETQQKIAEVIKRQTDTWDSFVDAQKAATKNAKLIKEQQKEIARLEKIGTEEAILKAKALEKEVEYLIQVNKEMLKTGTLVKGIGKSIYNWGMQKLPGIAGNLLDMFNKMDSASRRTSINMGMSVNRMNTFKTVAADSAERLTELGLEAAASGEMMGAMAEETGRQTMLTQESVIAMGALSQRLGMSHQEMAGMVGQMANFGLGAQDSTELVSEMAATADAMGVNTGKVIKSVQKNLHLVNKLSFRGGVKNMAKVAAYAEKMKLSMEEMASFADKVFRPEGAIDAAANLQVLGGGLAQLGDPMKIMYEARNNPEEFAKSLVKATGAVAVFNKKTGEFEVSAYELDRLKETSEATGISLESLVKTAKESARQSMFDGQMMKGLTDEEKGFLSSVAEMKNGKPMVMGLDGKYKELSKISKNDIAALKDKKESDEELALQAQTTQERLMNMFNSILASLLPYMDALEQEWGPLLIEYAKKLVDGIKYLIKNPYIIKLALGLLAFAQMAPLLKLAGNMFMTAFNLGKSVIGGVAGWFKKGVAMRKGFDSAGVTSMGGQAAAAGKGATGAANAGKGAAGMANAGKGAAGTQAMGQSAGGQAGNFLRGAVGLLAIAAALFVFAKALQEFEKLQNGWSTLLLAAGSLLVLAGALMIMEPILNSFGTTAWPGIAAMGALAVSVTALGFATTLFAQGGLAGTLLMVGALFALSAAVTMFGGLSLSGIGWAGVALILAMGAAMIMVGYAVKLAAEGISMIVDSFTNMFSIINMDNIGALLLLGPALIGVSIGVFALAVSLIALGAAMLLGGFLGLIGIQETADNIQKAFGDIDPAAVAGAITAINNVDMEKVAAIKDLANSLSMVSMFGGGFKIDFGDLDVKGNIKLEGKGGAANTDWVEDPIFVSKLKDIVWEAMDSDRNGGRN